MYSHLVAQGINAAPDDNAVVPGLSPPGLVVGCGVRGHVAPLWVSSNRVDSMATSVAASIAVEVLGAHGSALLITYRHAQRTHHECLFQERSVSQNAALATLELLLRQDPFLAELR